MVHGGAPQAMCTEISAFHDERRANASALAARFEGTGGMGRQEPYTFSELDSVRGQFSRSL